VSVVGEDRLGLEIMTAFPPFEHREAAALIFVLLGLGRGQRL
jgi:hypothetical protein